MVDAQPGDTLSFISCQRSSFEDFKTIPMKPLNPKKLKKCKKRLKEIIKEKKAKPPTSFSGAYDEVYAKGMESLENHLSIPVGIKGKIILK